jgi:hypothetical protein
MGVMFPDLSESALQAISEQIDAQGFGVATECISPETLQQVRSFVENSVNESGGQYVVFAGRENIHEPFLRGLGNSPEFVRACKTIYQKGVGKAPPAAPFYQVLRCLSGSRGERESYIFHYDSYVLTALVPIIIPTEGNRGDLVMLPNSRRIRKTYIANLIDKVMLDNKLSQKFLKWAIFSGRLRSTKIRMTPGNIYFFWGCRTIHANEPCDHDKIRATALFHYVDPYANSWLRRTMRRNAIREKVTEQVAP